MRISEELEKGLLKVEESSADNLVSLLDVATAFEKVYKYINTSFIKDEKDFHEVNDDIWCRKERYDSIAGKTIYSVGKEDDETTLFNIAVSNIGEISFEITSENKDEVEQLINEVNAPSSKLLELVKMNADVSFFTENKELVFSEKPYFALKMGNFVEGDKAVLVYREEGNDNDINKKNAGLKYIRVDQIEGYLENIKIDERIIPILAYAYLGQDYSDDLQTEKYYIKQGTYPKLTEEKVEYFTRDSYYNSMSEVVFTLSFTGAIALGIAGGVIGGITVLPIIPCLLVGAGLPIATGVGVYKNRCKQIERCNQKDELIDAARIKTYSSLKNAANKNVTYQEKELARKRAKKVKPLFSIKIGEKINVTETIRDVRKMISDTEYNKKSLYNVILTQILNVYQVSTSQTKDADLIDELSRLSDEVNNSDSTTILELINHTFTNVKRLAVNTNVNDSIDVLNSLNDAITYIAVRNNSVSNKKNILDKEIARANLEVMLQTKANDEEVSIESLASINSLTRSLIVNYLRDFAKRVKCFDDANKSITAGKIQSNCDSNEPSEVKIYKSVNMIAENDLTHDLLGKQIKTKVKKIEQK